jgi:hypothetical protein
MTNIGNQFVAALAAKQTEVLGALFAESVVFRGMTPSRFWEASTPDEIVHNVFYQWFESADVIEHVDRVETGRVGNRDRVDYLLRVRNPDGVFAVEQRAYFDVDDENRIVRMHVVCAGYQQYREHEAL